MQYRPGDPADHEDVANENAANCWQNSPTKPFITSQMKYGLKYGPISRRIRNMLIYNGF